MLSAKKNHLFRRSSFWWLSHLGHRIPSRIPWKADAPKTSQCLVRILVQRHYWTIFLRKWARNDRYSQWRSLSGHVEWIFVYKNLRGGYGQHLVSTGWRYVPHSRRYIRCLAACFWRSHCQPQSWCRMATSELQFDTIALLFVGAVKAKCYADKLETIDALKDNICKASGEIQLHTIDRTGYCMASRGSHLNEIIFHY